MNNNNDSNNNNTTNNISNINIDDINELGDDNLVLLAVQVVKSEMSRMKVAAAAATVNSIGNANRQLMILHDFVNTNYMMMTAYGSNCLQLR